MSSTAFLLTTTSYCSVKFITHCTIIFNFHSYNCFSIDDSVNGWNMTWHLTHEWTNTLFSVTSDGFEICLLSMVTTMRPDGNHKLILVYVTNIIKAARDLDYKKNSLNFFFLCQTLEPKFGVWALFVQVKLTAFSTNKSTYRQDQWCCLSVLHWCVIVVCLWWNPVL